MVSSWIMGSKVQVCLLIISIQVLLAAAETNNLDFTALLSLKDIWENAPPNWVGSDPCGDGWEGIRCNNSSVTAITLASMDLSGGLSGDIESLSELQILDLSYNKGLTGSLPQSIGYLKKLTNLILLGCSFTGPIPDTIGSLQQLQILSLSSNGFNGEIPPTIGKLSKLYRLDLADNKLTGTIPISSGTRPGLDMLVNTKHFHFGKNQLFGEIPSQLFSSNMSLVHVFFESNYLGGSIPSTLGLLQNLEALHLDGNKLTGAVPSNLNDLVHVSELFLSNNQLTGPLPNLTGMNVLSYVDISNNAFEVSDFPLWFSTLQSLTTLTMENTRLQGPIPAKLFSLPLLQTIVLGYNQLNGTLDLGSSNSDQLQLIDLRNNYISGFADETKFHVDGAGFNISLLLTGNPVCEETRGTETYCFNQQSTPWYSTPKKNCTPAPCSSGKISSPYCMCAHPYTSTLVFKAPSFSDQRNSDIYTSLETSLMHYFESHQFPVDSVSLSNPARNADYYFQLSLKIFPHGHDCFDRTEISGIGLALSNQTFKPSKIFGPVVFIGDPYGYFAGSSNGLGSSKGLSQLRFKVIIGVSVSVSAIIILIITIYRLEQKGSLSVNAMAFWKKERSEDQNMEAIIRQYGSLAPKQYKYSDINKMTNAFKEKLGEGGYGIVYKGKLSNGRLVAVKILSETKGNGEEFINEVTSISRTSHVNVVALLGFCFERNRRALVYEFVANGSLDNFIYNGESLEWKTLYQIAVGITRGLEYLHRGCSTRIVHFDIKPHNILLDEDFCPKISDFGLAKLCQMKQSIISMLGARGTAGYIAPEVFSRTFGGVSHKSDVYSYGMLVLEITGARENPGVVETSEVYFPQWIYEHLEHGKDLRLVRVATGEEEEIARKMILVGLWCIQTRPSDRPSMSKVLEMLEGSLESLQIPPKPSILSPIRLQTSDSDCLSSTMDLEVEMSASNPSKFQIPSKPLQFSPVRSGQSTSSKTSA